jgi:undecaprenyl diphosphate synthase
MAAKAPATAGLVNVPRHVAIIMDGNGRWAQHRGWPRLAGHRAGTENIRRILEAAVEFGIKYLTVYAFSTENWHRPADEVRGLMGILEEVIDRETAELHKNGVQLRHLGRMEGLAPTFQRKIAQALKLTAGNDRLILSIALNYGGRAEIVDAVKRIIQDGISAEAIDEALISRYLYAPDLPDVDLMIRTAGEMRSSNFLIWQASYTEYYFSPKYWPDFDKDELYCALLAYNQRERRFGKTSAQVR